MSADTAPLVSERDEEPREAGRHSAEPQVSAGEAQHRGRVIAVLSPKGGLGKTTLAANLAVGLARIDPESVVLVDADLQFGDVSNVLALEPTYTLPDMVTELVSADDIVVKTLLTPHPAGFFAVCGAESPVDGERVTSDQLGNLVQQLAATFKWVIVDTTPALGEHTLAVLDQATDAVALASLAVPNLRALRAELFALREIGFTPEFRHLVLNQAVDPGGLVVRDAESILEEPFDVVIPHSKAVPVSTNRGVPLLLDAPKDSAAKAIIQLLGRVTGRDVREFVAPRRRPA